MLRNILYPLLKFFKPEPKWTISTDKQSAVLNSGDKINDKIEALKSQIALQNAKLAEGWRNLNSQYIRIGISKQNSFERLTECLHVVH